MEMKFSLQILLATCNSGVYLRPQLDSLLTQYDQDFQILIFDGGSTDGTPLVIREYQQRYPEKICFLGSRKATARENFSTLLQASDADLVMFCDHDDIWLPDKVSRTREKYREMEIQYSADTPIMVFTDSIVADEQLHVIAPSMLRFQNLHAENLSLNCLILQNVPYGNTMLINRALAKLALPIPSEAVMHDHWLALTAAGLGKIGFLDHPTLYYRQHGNNIYGATPYSLTALLKKVIVGKKNIKVRFEQNIRQANAFGKRFGNRLDDHNRAMFQELEMWQDYSFGKKRWILAKYRIVKSGFWRNAGMFFLV